MRVMVINEYQINLGDESGRELVRKQMKAFLKLGESKPTPPSWIKTIARKPEPQSLLRELAPGHTVRPISSSDVAGFVDMAIRKC